MVAIGEGKPEEMRFRSILQIACKMLFDHGHSQGSTIVETRRTQEMLGPDGYFGRYIVLNPTEDSILRCVSLETGEDVMVLAAVSGRLDHVTECLIDLSINAETGRRIYKVLSNARAYKLVIAKRTTADTPLDQWDDDTELWPDHEPALETAIQAATMKRAGNYEASAQLFNAAYTMLDKHEKKLQAGTVVTPQLGFPSGLEIETDTIL